MSNNQYGYQQPHANPYQQAGWQQSPMIPEQDRSAAALAHGASLIAAVFSVGWLSFLGPLVMWVLYKDRSPHVREAAAGAFNFNIWVNILMVVGKVLTWTLLFAWIGIPMMIVAGFLLIWAHLRGVMKSMNGKPYVYKHQLRILN